MNWQLIDQLRLRLNANGLPYEIPIHPQLVHLTLGLFILAIVFDIAGALFALEKPILKFLGLPTLRSGFFDVGWYNLIGKAWNGEEALLIIAVIATGGLLALAALTARTTRYAIDAHAVTLRYGVALPATLVIPFAAIEHVGVRIHPDGTGDVALRLRPGRKVIYPKLWPHARPWKLLTPEPMLRCIPDAGVAGALLCRALTAREQLSESPASGG